MTPDQDAFLKEIDKRAKIKDEQYERLKKWALTIISGLIILAVSLGAANIKTTSANKTEIVHVKEDVSKVKADYVSVKMFQKLVASFKAQTEIMMKVGNGEVHTIEEVNRLFDAHRVEILYDIQPENTRGEKLKP